MEMDSSSASSAPRPRDKVSPHPLRKWFPIRKALRPLLFKPAPEIIISEQILLKSLEPDHVDLLFQLIEDNRAYLQRWISWIETIKTYAECKAFVNGVRYKDIFAGQWVYGIWHEEELVGLLDFNEADRELNQISIGYWLDQQIQSKGIATQSVMHCLDYVFEDLQLHRVLIKCAEENLRSQAIPQRLGFTWDGIELEAGTVNGETVHMITYSMLYREWATARQAYVDTRRSRGTIQDK